MKPEVIVKQQFLIDATGDVAYAVPEILLLGNHEGLRQLGECLLKLANESQSIGSPRSLGECRLARAIKATGSATTRCDSIIVGGSGGFAQLRKNRTTRTESIKRHATLEEWCPVFDFFVLSYFHVFVICQVQ